MKFHRGISNTFQTPINQRSDRDSGFILLGAGDRIQQHKARHFSNTSSRILAQIQQGCQRHLMSIGGKGQEPSNGLVNADRMASFL